MVSKNTITFLVPTYNSEKTIERALRSIINQSIQIEKIIVLDNGSTDTTVKIVENISKHNSLVRLIKCKIKQNKPAALNQGLEIVESSFIGFLDSDDILHKDFVLFHLNGFELQPNALISQVSYSREIDHSSKVFNLKYDYYGKTDEIIKLYSSGEISVVLWNKLYKSVVFNNFRFDESLILDDAPSMYKLLFENHSIILNKSKLYIYSFDINSLSNRPKSIQYINQNIQISLDTLFYFENIAEYKIISPKVMNRLFLDLIMLANQTDGKKLLISKINEINSKTTLGHKLEFLKVISKLPPLFFKHSIILVKLIVIDIILIRFRNRGYK
jgi:glycosyltransferase involved in cell wall biosynthesis